MPTPTLRPLLIATVLIACTQSGCGGSSGSAAPGAPAKGAGGGAPVTVAVAAVAQRDLAVQTIANGSVVSMQSTDIRAQTTSTVKALHIAEGQQVAKGDLLVTLDARTEEANLKRAEAQVLKTKSDLANAERNLARQKDLFDKKFIAQAALDTASTQLDVLKGQLAVDQAALEAARVSLSLTEIRAPFAGRTGSIAVRPGAVVQPNSTPMLSVTQMDPIYVAFALPERELPAIQRAQAAGSVPVSITLNAPGSPVLAGKLAFIENSVDSGAGTIAMKAVFSNKERQLWPGMFVNVSLTTRVIPGALVLPVQAVQTGPERQFVFVLDEAVDGGHKVKVQPVKVEVTQGGLAVLSGLAAGTRVVAEGAQNVRVGNVVREGKPGGGKDAAPKTAATGTSPSDPPHPAGGKTR
ncbi:MAG: efflux RND transporter periplasmic adaptor subunit [Betaproteobacteria bacterium]|nr:efflux RND transporter periplasmic adaptor subunit [Betaproteobacteria bacterium]